MCTVLEFYSWSLFQEGVQLTIADQVERSKQHQEPSSCIHSNCKVGDLIFIDEFAGKLG